MKIIPLKPNPPRSNKLVDELGDNIFSYLLSIGLTAALSQTGRWGTEECAKQVEDLVEKMEGERMKHAKKGASAYLIEPEGGGYIGIVMAICIISPLFPEKEQALDWISVNESMLVHIAKASIRISRDK